MSAFSDRFFNTDLLILVSPGVSFFKYFIALCISVCEISVSVCCVPWSLPIFDILCVLRVSSFIFRYSSTSLCCSVSY